MITGTLMNDAAVNDFVLNVDMLNVFINNYLDNYDRKGSSKTNYATIKKHLLDGFGLDILGIEAQPVNQCLKHLTRRLWHSKTYESATYNLELLASLIKHLEWERTNPES